jgi:hypothetical protein
VDKAATLDRPSPSKGQKPAKPTLHRFLQLEARFDNLLSRQSILSEQKSEQRKEKIQKRLTAIFGPGPQIADYRTIATVFTEKELEEVMLAPIKEMAAIEQGIHLTLAEIKDLCAKISFDGFIEKLFRRGKSSGDWVDYSAVRNQIVMRLSERKAERGEPSSRKAAVTRRQKTAERDIELSLRFVVERAAKPSRPGKSALMERVGERYNLTRNPSIEACKNGLERLGIQPNWHDCKHFYDLNRDALLARLDRRIDTAELMKRLKLS